MIDVKNRFNSILIFNLRRAPSVGCPRRMSPVMLALLQSTLISAIAIRSVWKTRTELYKKKYCQVDSLEIKGSLVGNSLKLKSTCVPWWSRLSMISQRPSELYPLPLTCAEDMYSGTKNYL